MEREWSVDEIIESLRTWEDRMYSESETKWLMNKAADLIARRENDMEECRYCDYNVYYDGILVGVFESKEYDSCTRTYSKALVINKETGALLSVSPHGIFIKRDVKKEDE